MSKTILAGANFRFDAFCRPGSWLDCQGDCHTPTTFVRQAFRKYLEYGIFARARCVDCGHDDFVAFSCKGCGVCPS